MMFADDVVLFAKVKDVLELKLEQWRKALENRGMKVSRAKTRVHVPEWNAAERSPNSNIWEAPCRAMVI